MASEGSLQGLLEEASCSICLDLFQDPVLVPECGHNFCRGCLTRSWGTSGSEASCPQCRQSFAPRSLLPNRQLARVAEEARRCSGHPGEEGGSFCPKHREPLKLFCKRHQTLICVVCDRSKEHKGHSVIPAEEAFQEYQIKVGDCLKTQKEEKEKIATYKRDTEQRMQEMLDLIEKVKKNVVAEFRKLQLWLEGQEKLLLTRMEETEKDIMARKKKGLAKHMEELCSLDRLIQEIEEKHQQPASKLLQDIGSNLKKYQAKETYENPVDLRLDPKRTIRDYSEISLILKRAMQKLRDTLESGLRLQEENVILDPDTAHPGQLDISEDKKRVKGLKPVKEIYAVPNCKRFERNPYVFGCQKFSSGRHFWGVMGEDREGRAVGAANKSLNITDVNKETSHWQIGDWRGNYMAISSSSAKPALSKEELEKKAEAIIAEYLCINDMKEALQCVQELGCPTQLYIFVRHGIESTLERSTIAREHMGLLLYHLVKAGHLSKEQYYKGMQKILEIGEDMEIDIPHIWPYLAEIITPILREGGIPMEELFREIAKPLVPIGKAATLLVEILGLLCKGMSHKKAGTLWREGGLSWKEFLPENQDISKFITEQKVEYTMGDSPDAPSRKELTLDELFRQLDKLFKENANNQRIYNWIEVNLSEQVFSSMFIRALMTSVCHSAVVFENRYRMDSSVIKIRAKLLQKYLSDEDKELQALYALQALVVKLDQPPNLLRMFFDALYDEDVIKEDAFYKWESSKDPAEQQGKGVALRSVTAFYTWLRDSEDESGNN